MAYKSAYSSSWTIFWKYTGATEVISEALECVYFCPKGNHTVYVFDYLNVKHFLRNPDWNIFHKELEKYEMYDLLDGMKQWIEEVEEVYIRRK